MLYCCQRTTFYKVFVAMHLANIRILLLKVQWAQIFESLLVDEMWSHFHDTFTTLINEYIPTSDMHNPKVASWMSPTALHKSRLKRKAWMKYKITQNDSDFVAYTQCRNDATKAVRACKRCFEKR